MKKLLIIDEDRHLLNSLRVVFTDTYQVLTALSAEEASVILESCLVDVVLLGVGLPNMNGVEFLRKTLEAHPGLPVVMVSGASSIRSVMKALEMGAFDYIRKPFDIDELRFVVQQALETARLRRRLKKLESEQVGPSLQDEKMPLKKAVEAYERVIIKDALHRTGGVQTRAAEELGTTRRILRYRIEKLCIDPQ